MERQSFTPRHAVTYETTPEGPQMVDDQVVTAEADMTGRGKKPEAKPEPAAPLPNDSAAAAAETPADPGGDERPARRRATSQE